MNILERMTGFLLEQGGPSIRLRVKREIFGSVPEAEETALLEDIMTEPAVDEDFLHGISTYGGQQIEADWKTPVRKFCDITFRTLLCGKYAGVL